ncbi:unnamed protein product [Meganyctiphanes norvegica]|uniref:Uncharacterized protein n=1 Tax=Meganyctiphanes norvegica TaxID=48144 RepID=A0AAV2SJ28_MEGNR
MRDSIKTYVKNKYFSSFLANNPKSINIEKKSFLTFLFILQFYIFWYKMSLVAQLEVEKILNIYFANLWWIITHAIIGGDSSNLNFLGLNFFLTRDTHVNSLRS